MLITDYKDLDILIAKSLGWESSIELIDQGEFVSDLEVEYYHPPDLDELTLEDWFGGWGIAPDFSEQWYIVEDFILAECDRLNLIVGWERSRDSISCRISTKESFNYGFCGTGKDVNTNFPRSMPLATCLAWLSFKEVEFELRLEND